MNRKEYNEWVDDSYLLMGKARLYKHEYEPAKATLSYIISSTADPAIKTESTIWLARVYNETGNFNESSRILKELDMSKENSKALKEMYFTTLADLFMKQKRFSEAVEPLEKSLQFVTGKRHRYRLTYLLAQICEKTGDSPKATRLYRTVANMNAPYEVEFNARINLAGVFDLNSGNPETIKKELNKMLRDSKNKEFRDQIFFALANLSKKEGKINDAVNFYKKSVAASTSNQNQKGKSYLALAEYFYTKPDYLNAGKYYDSTMMYLSNKYPDYEAIRSKSLNLNSLVSQLMVIQKEDSLQKVARMSPAERSYLIASIIEKVTVEESKMKTSDPNTDRYNLGQYYENERRFQGNIDQEGKWYFYNQAALTFGRTEFRRRWGDRRLEDNWRRLNKSRLSQSQISGNNEENGQAKTDSSSQVMDNKKPEFYLRDLPTNDTLINISNDKIATAMLESGKIYHEKFADNTKAADAFESLIRRFPGNILEPEVLYNLHNVFKEENRPRAETYRQRLLEKYPENEFSKILSDPEYYSKKIRELQQTGTLYESAYNDYLSENYSAAVSKCDSALARYPKHELAPKFMLLKDYCIARTSGEKIFKEELNKLVKQWPSSAEARRAGEIIAWLNQEIPQLKVEEDRQIAKEIYIDEKESAHVFVLIIQNSQFNINQATFDVISYNIDNYTNKNFRTQGALVDDKYIMITVSGFADLNAAMDYYKAFNTNQIVRNPNSVAMTTFIIGKRNMEALNSDKNPERYRIFFNEKYLKAEEKK
jgi:predicted negative regulator of RcsB-dependent stress response